MSLQLGRVEQSTLILMGKSLVVQAGMNVAAALGSCIGPLTIGALTKANAHTGWRTFYVIPRPSLFIFLQCADLLPSGYKWDFGD